MVSNLKNKVADEMSKAGVYSKGIDGMMAVWFISFNVCSMLLLLARKAFYGLGQKEEEEEEARRRGW